MCIKSAPEVFLFNWAEQEHFRSSGLHQLQTLNWFSTWVLTDAVSQVQKKAGGDKRIGKSLRFECFRTTERGR